ncbi:hypothetical protein H072_8609 [Dactylellina haptotyla CBS 200.50]|uniref:Uncharacterized protein n=1 Tax=Dactylellina haptotyla (strain CBS 200.50) TaxID=1284197 RepID=S8A425_DACHA|nr:hypothetical protein H072_8609 [Dactylellina haptotyla CBS 200.50]
MKLSTFSLWCIFCLIQYLKYARAPGSVAEESAEETRKISPKDWELYLEREWPVYKNILNAIGRFKNKRRLDCSIGSMDDPAALSPDWPTSLNYNIKTISMVTTKLSDVIYQAQPLQNSGRNAEEKELLLKWGVTDVLSLKLVFHRIFAYYKMMESLEQEFLEQGEGIDEFPSRGDPTPWEAHNIRILALYIEDATSNGMDMEDNIETRPGSRNLVFRFWNVIREQSMNAASYLTQAIEFSDRNFNAPGFTEIVSRRDLANQVSSSPPFTVSRVLLRLRDFFSCWAVQSQGVLDKLQMLRQLPDPITEPEWITITDEEFSKIATDEGGEEVL